MATHNNEVFPDPIGSSHIPVLLEEVLAGLTLRPGIQVIDGTLGGGGHAVHILSAIEPNGRLLGLDADPAAIRRVQRRLRTEIQAGRLRLVQGSFAQIAQIAATHGFRPVQAILLDLGVSSFQLETAERGFSFSQPGPIDMRFDPEQGVSAADIVNNWDVKALADLIHRYGEERHSRRIARYIVENRPFSNTQELAEVILKAVGGRKGQRIHPATRTFQALRIAANRELEQLTEALPHCLDILEAEGRLAVISFHSLEDRIVKQWSLAEAQDFVRDPTYPAGGYERAPRLRIVTRKPLTASKAEVRRNPRSRSAKLRIVERI